MQGGGMGNPGGVQVCCSTHCGLLLPCSATDVAVAFTSQNTLGQHQQCMPCRVVWLVVVLLLVLVVSRLCLQACRGAHGLINLLETGVLRWEWGWTLLEWRPPLEMILLSVQSKQSQAQLHSTEAQTDNRYLSSEMMSFLVAAASHCMQHRKQG